MDCLDDDYAGDSSTSGVVATGGSITGSLQECDGGDHDWFRINLTAGRTYQFDLRGLDSGQGTLSDPTLALYDHNSIQISHNFDGGVGRDARIRFTATYDADFFLAVAGALDSIGTYRLTAIIDDYETGIGTTGRIDIVPNTVQQTSGEFENPGDIDWFKVNLVAGRWYWFNSSLNESTLMLRNPNGAIVVGSYGSAPTNFYYQAQQSGQHYLIARNGLNKYILQAADNPTPKMHLRQKRFLLTGTQFQKLSSMLWTGKTPFSKYQIYSFGKLSLNGVVLQKQQIHELTPDEFRDVIVDASLERGEFEIFVRGTISGTKWTGWTNVPIVSITDLTPLVDSGFKWHPGNTLSGDLELTFGFPTDLPPYFTSERFPGFEQVHSELQRTISGMFEEVDSITGISLTRDDAQADIQIFAADIDDVAMGYRPGPFGYGDLMISADVNSDPDLVYEGGEIYYRILRAVGRTLGLKHWVPELNREQSIMGRNHPSLAGHAYPSTLGIVDIAHLENVYGAMTPSNQEVTRHQFGIGRTFVRTVASSGGWDAIEAESGFDAAVMIDLREGHTSRVLNESVAWQSFKVQYGTLVREASGSDLDDVLIGNAAYNLLFGRGGADVLFGEQGNDFLAGGLGSDFYSYTFGDGDDTIGELVGTPSTQYSNNDLDALRITGYFGFDSLEDLTFRRSGFDLVIELNINGTSHRDEGSIRIKNMGGSNWQVERLVLENPSGRIGAFSLVSIWDQTTDFNRRFMLGQGHDGFGHIVAPSIS